MSEKLCCFCRNAGMDSTYYESMGYDEFYTCEKGHFETKPTRFPLVRKEMLQAETCRDYEPAED